MCCSEKEIGISDDNSGIMEITDDLPNGTDIKDAYQVDDIIFEVDNKSLTNRPDLWGHYGIAREFAALSLMAFLQILQKTDSLRKITHFMHCHVIGMKSSAQCHPMVDVQSISA